MSTTETGKPIIYQNEKYQFSLTLPSSWKGHYKVEEVHWNPSADVVIDFNFTYQGEVLSTLFSIHILSEELDEEAPLTYIASNDEKTFAYTKALEIPEAFYENEQLKAEQDQFLHMMNQDVPQIIESMQFES
ncbi:hypothetical protein [Paracerasibacillus soli]|uniref:Uncharacterized protein n=2 Tax=Paracerasibacillus soli TaxID=480284 RepID=A0ABU5CRZ6_9BACI|nr:hypothetical protein [Virgibacillus soli]MDY0409119.1 hypothetical protein [Virgibacillus soli]